MRYQHWELDDMNMKQPMGKAFVVLTTVQDTNGRDLRGEILYWESLDGLYTLKSAARRFSHDFDQPNLTWAHISDLPENVEFIGNYPMPTGIR